MNKSLKIIKINDHMHHCSSIYNHSSNQNMIAFYTGPECKDDQHVVILNFVDGEIIKKLELEPKTGNPIIFGHGGKIYLIYSKFEDCDEYGNKIDFGCNLVLRWKHCNNYLCELDENLKILSCNLISGCFGRLARCQPLNLKNRLFIPLYKEHDPICEIWELVNGNLKFISNFGHINNKIVDYMNHNNLNYNYLGEGVAIQPTLFVKDGYVHAWCRNVCKSSSLSSPHTGPRIWVSRSKDCHTWEDMDVIDIPNYNSSLYVCEINNHNFMFFNLTRNRSDLLMAKLPNRFCVDISHKMNECKPSFSYPNASYNFGKLHIVHSNCGCIAWHIMDEKFINETFK